MAKVRSKPVSSGNTADGARLHLPASKPRNPLVAAALTRRAGAHGQTEKAARQQQRQRLQQQLDDLLTGETAEFELEAGD
jgi:hypothetical protein